MAECVKNIGVQGVHVHSRLVQEGDDHPSYESVLLFAGQRQYFHFFAIFKVRTRLSSSNFMT